MADSTARPRQVTLAAWSIMVGSVVVVVSGFETITGLHTLETREAIQRALSDAPASGLGLDVGGVQQLIKVSAMVAAGCATAAAILGYQILQRNRTARIALSILAVPLFLAGIATGGFFSSLVAVAVAMLWLHPARAWFNGTWRPDADRLSLAPPPPSLRPPQGGPPQGGPPHGGPPQVGPPQVGPPSAGPPEAGQPPSATPPDAEPSPASARPMAGFGTPAAADPWAAYPPSAVQAGGPPTGAWPSVPAARPRRPAALVWAGVLTWVFGGLVLLSTVAAVIVLAADAAPVLEELHRQQPELADQGVSDDLIVAMTFAMAGVVAFWAIVAMLLAGLAFAGMAWARLALLLCVASSAGLLLVSVLVGQLVLLLPLTAAVATCVLLSRPEVGAWYAKLRDPIRS